jgi:electron transfer flavoprotein beta subunit
MNILVCISKVPDTTSKISFTENNTKFNTDKIQFIINPYDEWYALVRAIEIKEKSGGKVTVIHAGPAANDQLIRKALAIGADEAFRIDMEPEDSYSLAAQIANHIKASDYDLILTGKETIDYNSSALGGMIAELADLPFVSYVSKLEVEGDKFLMTREIEGGEEICEYTGKLVISAQKGMAEARIPNMRGIMMARSKPLNVIPAEEVGSLTKIKVYEMPPEKTGCKYVDAEHPEELIDLLHNEAKVI